jgi:hypothetical protein
VNLGPGFTRRIPLSGGKEAELYVIGREDAEERVAREAVEELIEASRYQRRYSRRLRDAVTVLRLLELDVGLMRDRVAEVLRTEELDDVDRSLFRQLLDELDGERTG